MVGLNTNKIVPIKGPMTFDLKEELNFLLK